MRFVRLMLVFERQECSGTHACKPAAVLTSLEDCVSLEETRYLLRSPASAERLMGAIGELDQGAGRAQAS